MITDGPTAEESAIVSRHFAHLEALTAERTVLLAGRTTDADGSTFGIVILRAASEEAARRLMSTDPAVQHGVMTAVLHPFRVALRADRWDDDPA
jgi:uncharacterized protein YciI